MKITSFKRIVILTGAGISAESGLATFRDSNGLWENHRIEDVATPEAFRRSPETVWRFYSLRRLHAKSARPNRAHEALVEFAGRFNGQVTLVTQNVDGLHEKADPEGKLPPLNMHGTLGKSRCTHCEKIVDDHVVHETLPVSTCCGKLLRPHIVWFGEMPLSMDVIEHRLLEADLFVSIGTSGQVYPAAGFLQLAKSAGATTVCINKEPLPQNRWVDHFIQGNATEKVPEFFLEP